MRAALAELASRRGSLPARSAAVTLPNSERKTGGDGEWVEEDGFAAAWGASSSDEEDGFSDLDDFIECKPGRDYARLFSAEFRYTARN